MFAGDVIKNKLDEKSLFKNKWFTLTPEKRIKSQMSAITITNVVDAVKSELVAIEPTRFGPNGLTENGRSFMQAAVGGFRRIKPTPQVTPAIKSIVLATKPESWTLKENVVHAPKQQEPQNLTMCVADTGYELIVETHPYHENCCIVFTRYVNGDSMSRKVMEACNEAELVNVINEAERRIAQWCEFTSILKSMSFTAKNEGQYELLLQDSNVRIQVLPSLFPTCECCMVFRLHADTKKRLDAEDWEAHTPKMFKQMMEKILQNPYEMSF